MNIVYASNDGYARHLAVSMTSLFDRNRRTRQITVYVISMGISGESREKLESIAAQYGREIHFAELENVEGQFACGIDTRSFDVSAMGRLFAGRLLPEQVERVLYLDCDTVVAQPLMELWRTDLRGCTLGAVIEPTIYRAVKKIGFTEKDFYVNSGVLLIDLKRWRQTGAERKLLEFYESKGGSLFACDQDTINGALKGQIFPLPPRYNFFTNYRYFSYQELIRQEPVYADAVKEEEFDEAKRHPVIIHYAGDERPWYAGNLNHYRKAYEHYLAMTPWAGMPKEKGKELYLLAYHLMDYATVVCPPVRRFISEHLAMRILAARNRKK